MILKDDAIVLRIYPFGNTSRSVVWLTRQHGKIVTLAKGSQRPGSALLGQFDLFYTCEVLFYAREQRQVHILKEALPLHTRDGLRRDWRACAVASYSAHLFNRALPLGPAPTSAFQLLASTLDHVAAHSPGPAFLLRLEALFLQELGLAPDWTTCAKCRRPLADEPSAFFEAAQGALHCPLCANGHGRPIAPASIAALQAVSAQTPLPAALPRRVFLELQALLGDLLIHHADLALDSRKLAFEVLRTKTTPDG